VEIQCLAAIPLVQDEPVPAIRQFVRLLRDGGDRAEVNLNLIGTSARARRTIQEFRPERTKVEPFARSLEIAEELTKLGATQIRSLHFLLSAEGFLWRGSSEASSAKLLLLDGKSFHRKKRFDLSALLTFRANAPKEPFIEKMLGEITKATGIHFRVQTSLMRVQPNEPGRATPEELFRGARRRICT